MDRDDLKKAMLQAQEMQLGILKVQEELAQLDVKGASKDAMVEVTMSAQGDTKQVSLKPEAMSADKAQLEKSILEAIREATKNSAELAKEKLAHISQQLGL